jgi:hypothetical protein
MITGYTTLVKIIFYIKKPPSLDSVGFVFRIFLCADGNFGNFHLFPTLPLVVHAAESPGLEDFYFSALRAVADVFFALATVANRPAVTSSCFHWFNLFAFRTPFVKGCVVVALSSVAAVADRLAESGACVHFLELSTTSRAYFFG